MSSQASTPPGTYNHPFLLSSHSSSVADTPGPSSVTTDFMGFPREVRDMVYEHALCVDGILAPCAEIFKVDGDYTGPPPTVALLATNRQIRTEALPVLFGKNTWRIISRAKKLGFRYKREGESDLDYQIALEFPSNLTQRATLLGRHGGLIRRVALDCHCHDLANWTADATYTYDSVGTIFSGEQRLHDLSVRRLHECWREKGYILFCMGELTSVVIDINYLYCSFGCCRPKSIEGLFGNDFLHSSFTRMVKYLNLKLPIFQVKGTRDEAEEKVVEKWLQGLTEPAVSQRRVRS